MNRLFTELETKRIKIIKAGIGVITLLSIPLLTRITELQNYEESSQEAESLNITEEGNHTILTESTIMMIGNSNEQILIEAMKEQQLEQYQNTPSFDETKMSDYLAYQEQYHTSIEDSVIQVNIGLNKEFYEDVTIIEEPDNLLALVNKYNQLPSDYIPEDLTALKCNPKFKLRQEAAEAFDLLIEAAKEDGIKVEPYSAYRSYNTQVVVYNRHLENSNNEVKIADTFSARPGHSEHQTGLAVDIRTVNQYEISESDYEWMKENSYKYGFIIRYPEGKTDITGYQEEPWQLRYVGLEAAKEITEMNVTLDEYWQLKELSYHSSFEKK